jgi:hypothetical protein
LLKQESQGSSRLLVRETAKEEERIAVMRPQLLRLNADILCLQEVNRQKDKAVDYLGGLDELLKGTKYSAYDRAFTKNNATGANDEQKLLVLSRHKIEGCTEIKHDYVKAPLYGKMTSLPPEDAAKEITWERPVFYLKIELAAGRILHLVDLHLKSRIPTEIKGQKVGQYAWKTAGAWAEGFFLSSMKRVGQALEVRVTAIRGPVEETANPALVGRIMVPCELSVPEPSRFSILHLGKGSMFDQILVSRSLLAYYRGAEIHNEALHDESGAFRTNKQFPESDHAPVVAEFELP